LRLNAKLKTAGRLGGFFVRGINVSARNCPHTNLPNKAQLFSRFHVQHTVCKQVLTCPQFLWITAWITTKNARNSLALTACQAAFVTVDSF
jgi:hypothetical protein